MATVFFAQCCKNHPLNLLAAGDVWLVGGASNSGGAVLRKFFTDEQMRRMTPLLNPSQPTGLAYYPLPAMGERFPENDPQKQPRMEPRPSDDVVFFQGQQPDGQAAVRLINSSPSGRCFWLKSVHVDVCSKGCWRGLLALKRQDTDS